MQYLKIENKSVQIDQYLLEFKRQSLDYSFLIFIGRLACLVSLA